MAGELIIHKGRTNIIPLSMGRDVSGSVITSEIRAEPEQDSALIAIFVVTEVTDGTDGELLLTLDDLFSGQILASKGYMDVKMVTGGEPLPVFDAPLEVIFQGTVTV